MKKLILLSFTLLFLLVATPVAAQEEQELPDAGITPDSPFYFLDTLGENFGLFFAFGNEAKAQKAAEIAGEKAAEVEQMADKGKTDEAEVAADRYGAIVSTAAENLAQAAQSGEDVDAAVAEVVARATSIHLSVLTDVYNRVPEQAKPAIERAMQQGETGATEALNALNGKPDVDQIRQEVQQRVEEARQQRGIPEGVVPGAGMPDNIQQGAPEGVGQPQGVGNTERSERGGPPTNIPSGRP